MKYKTKKLTVTCVVCGESFFLGEEEIMALYGTSKPMHPLTLEKVMKHMPCSVNSGIKPDKLYKFEHQS